MYLNNKLQNMAIHKNIQEQGLFLLLKYIVFTNLTLIRV
jgi:hypothetical protein